jgi:hypothetical protein
MALSPASIHFLLNQGKIPNLNNLVAMMDRLYGNYHHLHLLAFMFFAIFFPKLSQDLVI